MTGWTGQGEAAALRPESQPLIAPSQPSVVSVSGRQLMVQKRQPDGSLAAPTPYVIKGIDWTPATRAPANGDNPLDPHNPADQVQYGFFFHWPGRNPDGPDVMNYWLKQEIPAHVQTDAALMAQMNVNTVRIYSDLGTDPAVYQKVLDAFYNNGIMVIMTVAGSAADITSGQYVTTVNLCKNHPAILMWSIGNEWNFNNPYLFGYSSIGAANAAVNQAAQAIKTSDPNHPVTSSLGDKWTSSNQSCPPDQAGSDIPSIVSQVNNVDIWGINA